MNEPARREYRTWTLDSRRWDGYVPTPGDIIIATAPKCGTTWMQQIVSSLIFQDAIPRALPAISPWIDQRFRTPAAEMFATVAAQSHRRFLKSHLPVDGLPIHDEVRYIHVARDGRDALMSMHNHFTGFSDATMEQLDRCGLTDPSIARPYPRLPADPAAFFRLWMSTPCIAGQSDGMTGPSFFDLEVGYWAARRRPNFLLVHFNDLRADLDGEMRRIAAFLQIDVNQDIWPDLMGAAGFAAMQKAGETLMPHTRTMFRDGGAQRFFNKGTNGRWRDVLTDADLALYDAKIREKFSPGLAAWLEGGRRAAGDPRERSD